MQPRTYLNHRADISARRQEIGQIRCEPAGPFALNQRLAGTSTSEFLGQDAVTPMTVSESSNQLLLSLWRNREETPVYLRFTSGLGSDLDTKVVESHDGTQVVSEQNQEKQQPFVEHTNQIVHPTGGVQHATSTPFLIRLFSLPAMILLLLTYG